MVGVGWMLGYYNVESVGYVVENKTTYDSSQLPIICIVVLLNLSFFVQMLAVGSREE